MLLGIEKKEIAHLVVIENILLGILAIVLAIPMRAMEVSGKYGAYASLGLTLNGILTALLTPTILHLLGLY